MNTKASETSKTLRLHLIDSSWQADEETEQGRLTIQHKKKQQRKGMTKFWYAWKKHITLKSSFLALEEENTGEKFHVCCCHFATGRVPSRVIIIHPSSLHGNGDSCSDFVIGISCGCILGRKGKLGSVMMLMLLVFYSCMVVYCFLMM